MYIFYFFLHIYSIKNEKENENFSENNSPPLLRPSPWTRLRAATCMSAPCIKLGSEDLIMCGPSASRQRRSQPSGFWRAWRSFCRCNDDLSVINIRLGILSVSSFRSLTIFNIYRKCHISLGLIYDLTE